MSTLDVDAALAFALDLAREASETIRTRRPRDVSSKTNPADLCTEMDRAIEKAVRARVQESYPEHSLEGEELGLALGSQRDYRWFVDPIDGTTNYVAGLPWCSFSLGLADEQGALLGVVADPFRHQTVTAVRGRGTAADGRRATVTPAQSVAGQVVLTEWAGHLPWPGMTRTLTAVAGAYGTTRIMGSSALALTSVAMGRAAGAIIGSSHAVDDLAGILLAREAGAVVVEREGGVLVAGPGVVEELTRLWHS